MTASMEICVELPLKDMVQSDEVMRNVIFIFIEIIKREKINNKVLNIFLYKSLIHIKSIMKKFSSFEFYV